MVFSNVNLICPFIVIGETLDKMLYGGSFNVLGTRKEQILLICDLWAIQKGFTYVLIEKVAKGKINYRISVTRLT